MPLFFVSENRSPSAFAETSIRRRLTVGAAVLACALAGLWGLRTYVLGRPAGAYDVRQGDVQLSRRDYAKAIQDFDDALKLDPNERGALLGKATALIRLHHYAAADKVLTHAIDYLTGHMAADDAKGRGVLAAAYGDRGIVHDREARYDEALADYIESLKINAQAVTGPGVIDRLLYDGTKPSSIRDRAEYLYTQLQLPEEKRQLREPATVVARRPQKP